MVNELFEKEGQQVPVQNESPEALAPVKEEPQAPAKPSRKSAPKAEAVPTDIFTQLLYVQQHLKVGKKVVDEGLQGTGDSFATRTLEDILTELKPILAHIGCVMTLDFQPVLIGQTIWCTAKARIENARGEARECQSSAMVNTGMMANKYPSQEALACGTMARKSALAGLFLLDDTTAESQNKLIARDIDAVSAAEKAAKSRSAKAPKAAPEVPKAAASEAPKAEEAKREAEAPAEKPAPKAEEVKKDEAPKAAEKSESPASEAPKAAAPAPAALPQRPQGSAALPARPASAHDPLVFRDGKPVLTKGTPAWQKCGIKASLWNGDRDGLVNELRRVYAVDDATAKEFCDEFLAA